MNEETASSATDTDAAPNPTNNATSNQTPNWRSSIAQSYRSSEVRSIASVLASLEPGATSASKTMLAMRFEESIFKAADSLEDYKKTIQKRLKRLQKHYSKQLAAAAGGGGGGGGDDKAGNGDDKTAGSTATSTATASSTNREKEILLQNELRETYGSILLYIAQHADKAVEKTREKAGAERANVLKQHANNAKQWAVNLGMELPEGCVVEGGKDGKKSENVDLAFLKKLKGFLEGRVDNIRCHIVKVTDPDLFIEETLIKLDEDFLNGETSKILNKTLREANTTHADATTETTEHSNSNNTANIKDTANNNTAYTETTTEDNNIFTPQNLKSLLQTLNEPIPIPRRNQEGDQLRAALARIEKVRAASQALYVYVGLTLEDKTSTADFRGMLRRCQSVAMECLGALEGEYDDLLRRVEGDVEDVNEKGGKPNRGESKVVLEDAWNKPLRLDDEEEEEDSNAVNDAPAIDDTEIAGEFDQSSKSSNQDGVKEEPSRKRQRKDHPHHPHHPLVIRSRVLLTPGRHIFSTLLPALKRKKATLVKSDSATYIQLTFGTAFEMTVYLVPLLVTIRAIPRVQGVNGVQGVQGVQGIHVPVVSLAGGLRWVSPYRGLHTFQGALSTEGGRSHSGTNHHNSKNATIANAQATTNAMNTNKTNTLSVLNTTGTYSTLAPIIAKKLNYASAQATYVLRRCFAETTVGRHALAKTEYEIEILEVGALIRFLQIARSTYIPGWVDED